MLGFIEPEMDFCWPVTVAPTGNHKASELLVLSRESRALGMRNNVILSRHSLPLLSGAASSETRFASNVVSRYVGGFFLSSQDCNVGLSSSLISCIPGDRSSFKSTAVTKSEISSSNQRRNNGITWSRKHQIIKELDAKKDVAVQMAKRHKIAAAEEKPQLKPPSADPNASRRQLMKAPAKRSQKLGDKITALQQLVSPFGKTDTASVLHEASVYIKILHEQIQVLTGPYFPTRSSSSPLLGIEEVNARSLRSRGLCLEPISSPVAHLANQAYFK